MIWEPYMNNAKNNSRVGLYLERSHLNFEIGQFQFYEKFSFIKLGFHICF